MKATTQEAAMAGAEGDKAKGRVKEAGGALTGDRSLKREGKVDRASGEAKRGIDRLTRGIRDLVGGRRRR
jgi:uncharacterized protein YjbJ (UPF0337 family)